MSITFGQTVRAVREGKSFTLNAFAAHVGISPAFLSRSERDLERPPSERVIVKIADALSIDSDDLLRLAGRIPADIEQYILASPNVVRRLRKAMRRSAA